jgi:uncharacterized LabA/DUF88 family protein
MLLGMSPGYRGPKEVKYLFVDGGCLRASLDHFAKRYSFFRPADLDFGQMIGPFSKVFYYDCLPAKRPEESDEDYQQRRGEQEAYFDRLRSLDRVHVYEGDARRRRKGGQEQKMVDILIAVDMLTHAFRRNMHEATLFTGDLDFKPLIDALVLDGMQVALWHPEHASKDLVQAADTRLTVSFRKIHEWCEEGFRSAHPLPDTYTDRPENFPSLDLAERWAPAGFREIDIWQGTQDRVFRALCRKDESNDSPQWTVARHADLALLKTYIEDHARELRLVRAG